MIVWAITFATLFAVSLNGLSRSIEEQAPKTALVFNPLNAEARINTLLMALNQEGAPIAGDLVGVAAAGLAASPVDPRFHSLLAELRLRMGEKEEAHRLFQQAHRLSHTEIHALRHLFAHAVETGDYAESIAYLDVLMRRWAGKADALPASLLPPLLSQEAAYAAVSEAMRSGVPWRGRMLAALARQENGLGIAYQLLLDFGDSEHPPRPDEIASVIRGYQAAKLYEDAYRLFRLSLPEAERGLTGFIHNGSFYPSPYKGPFSWDYRSTRAAEIGLSAQAPLAGATVRFLSVPAKDMVLNQTLLLPPGRYRLVVEAEASTLRAPRSLYWQVQCLDPRGELLRLPVPEGTYQGQLLMGEFVTEDCALQQIRLTTDLIAESWENRYSGYARFRSIKIERVGRAEAEG